MRMRIQRNILAAFTVIWLWPGIAAAVEVVDFNFKDTQDLLDVCTTIKSDPIRKEAIHTCVAFVIGAVMYHNAMSEHKDMKRLTCYPKGTSREQGAKVFIDWAQAHQGDKKLMGEAPVIGLMRSLSAKWPCK